MALLKLALASAVAYGLYRYATRGRTAPAEDHAALAVGEADATDRPWVRNAGPAAMRSDPPHWDKEDQASDESFPASDPPGNY